MLQGTNMTSKVFSRLSLYCVLNNSRIQAFIHLQ